MMGRRGRYSTRRGSEAPFDAVRYSRKIQIAFGGLLLAWIGCVGAYVLHWRPAAPPEVPAALPALVPAGPALETNAPTSYSAVNYEPGRLSGSGLAPLGPDLSSSSGPDVIPPASPGLVPPAERDWRLILG